MKQFLFALSFLFSYSVMGQDCFSVPGAYYIVNNTNDNGPGSLRNAINQINSSMMGGNIDIIIPSGSYISLFSSLPPINQDVSIIANNVTIEGNFIIEEPGIMLNSENSCIQGLNFEGFMPANLTVTNTNDDGEGSLRSVIQKLNFTSNGGIIRFDIPGIAPHTISPLTALPVITKPVEINGSSQPKNGYTGNSPLIHITGSSSGAGDGLSFINSQKAVVFGLKVSGFRRGLYISPDPLTNSHQIEIGGVWGKNVFTSNSYTGVFCENSFNATFRNNYFGIDPVPNTEAGNQVGLYLFNDKSSLVQNNVISGNSETGLFLQYSENAIIKENKIGTDINGVESRGNRMDGITVMETISASIENNVISGNGSSATSLAAGVKILGNADLKKNKIGTDAYGTYAIPNYIGILIESGNSQIGSSSLSDANLISGNISDGIFYRQPHNLIINNNRIGTNLSGNLKIGNNHGINGTDGELVVINNNIISGNRKSGIIIRESLNNIDSLQITNNRIGVNNLSTDTIGNNTGITISHTVSSNVYVQDNIIGGNQTAITLSGKHTQLTNNHIGVNNQTENFELPNLHGILINGSHNYIYQNIIAHNDSTAIIIEGSVLPVKGNKISMNSFYNNNGKAISLINPVGSNDFPHNNIQSPGIHSVSNSGASGKTYPDARVELYSNHSSNNHLQGQSYIGFSTADHNGNWSINTDLEFPCQLIALVIDSENNTSAFSSYKFKISINDNADEVGYCSDSLVILNTDLSFGNIVWSNKLTEPTITADTAGKYWVDATDICNQESSDTIVVIDKEVPLTADFTYLTNNTEVSFSDLSSGSEYYHWDFGDGKISEEQNPVHNFIVDGTYTVELKVENYCFKDSIEYLIQTGTITSNINKSNLDAVFADGKVLINSPESFSGILYLTDLSGKTVSQSILIKNGQTMLDLSINPGMYMLSIYSKELNLFYSNKILIR